MPVAAGRESVPAAPNADYDARITGSNCPIYDFTDLLWHYGPTEDDPDPGKRWHDVCGGEVWILEGGYICRKCGQQAERVDDGW